MRGVPVAQKAELVRPYLQRAGLLPPPPGDEACAAIPAIVQAAGERIKVAGDILDYADFFTPDAQLAYDDKAFDKRLRQPPEAAAVLTRFRDRLAAPGPFDAAALEQLLQRFITDEGIEIGQIIHALRVAITGKAVGFGMFDTMAILGRPRCLARIQRALTRCADQSTAPPAS